MAAGYNVLLVSLDTTGADRLGCYGYPEARAKTIDKLTTNGVRFANVTAPAPHAEKHAQRPYDGEISFVDAEFGPVVEHLLSRGPDAPR